MKAVLYGTLGREAARERNGERLVGELADKLRSDADRRRP
jgi:hypothetical protein